MSVVFLCANLTPSPAWGAPPVQMPKPWPTQESGRYEKVGGQLQVPGSTWKEAGGSGRDEPLGKMQGTNRQGSLKTGLSFGAQFA